MSNLEPAGPISTTPCGKQGSPAGKETAKEPSLEMVNLSSQMTDMELLTKRKAKKRVRFSLPEPDNRPVSSQDFSSFENRKIKTQTKYKKRVAYQEILALKTTCKEPSMMTSCSGENGQPEMEILGLAAIGKVGDDDELHTANKKVKLDNIEVRDENNNCSNSVRKSIKRKMMRQRTLLKCKKKKQCKSISLSKKLVSKHKANLLKRDRQKRQKALCLKRKRESENTKAGCSKLKRTKSKYVNRQKKPLKQKGAKERKGKICKVSIVRKSGKTQKKERRTKALSTKGKLYGKIKHKLLLAKSLKRKALKRKLHLNKQQKIQAAKRVARKKSLLKRELIEKRKRRRKMAKSRATKKIINKKPKKPKFIPIIREEDVSVSMRVNLLIVRTFQRAKREELHCCTRNCSKDWEELDMEDVYNDFE